MDRPKLLFIAAALFAACGCLKAGTGSDTQTITPVPDDGTAISVKAPVLTDGTALSWKKGDVIVVSDQAKDAALYKMTAQDDGEKVTFKGVIPKTMTSYKAFYPGGLVTVSSGATNFRFTWDGAQKGSPGTVTSGTIPMVAYESDIQDGISFRSVAAAVRFSITGNDIASVDISFGSGDSDYAAADIIAVNCSTLNTSITDAKSISRTLSMTPSEGDVFTPGDYCFGLLSKSSARAINGYTLTYRKSDGSTVVRKSDNLLSVTPGGVITIPGDETEETLLSSKVSGKVTDSASGKGIAGVPVSDGIRIVTTASDGTYSFTSDLTKAQNVFVIMPSEYEFSFNGYGGWDDHRLIDASKKEQTADFVLTKRSGTTDKFRLLLLGDPQQMSSRPHSAKSWTYVCNAINAYRTSVSVPLYQISMGDMVTNEIEVPGMAEAYLATQKTSGVRTFSVPGNHDHVQKATSYYNSIAQFSRWFGPYNYAFNLGRQHFIFLDSCAWAEDGKAGYSCSLNEQGITFLENDLALVDKDTPVHIFTHCPLTKKQAGAFPTTNIHHDRMIKAFAGRCVNMWYGHIHYNVNYSYTSSELSSKAPGVKSLDSHIVARCGGCWACSGEVCHDGSPRGFVELDIDGTSSHWQFHSIDSNYPQVFNTYLPGQFKGEGLTKVDDAALYCNVYMWDNLWSLPEIWTGGAKKADMTKVVTGTDASYDPLYQHFYPIWKAEGLMEVRDEPPGASENMHLFKYTPETGVTGVEIRVTDRWGYTEKRTINW